MKKYIVIDIGGTAIKYGIINEQGTILQKHVTDTEAWKGGPHILEKVVGIVDSFVSENTRYSGVCISSAGMVDVNKGEIFYSGPTVPEYAGTQYKKTIKEKFDLPCEIENDVNCAGIAEYKTGAGRGSNSMVCLTVGTGIGGCVILDGHVLHGASCSAGEIGYMNVDGGEFQSLGAASVLSKRVAERKCEDPKDWDGIRIFAKAKEGDKVCIESIDEMCDVLGKGIANICYVVNPDTIVLGGGIMAQKEFLYPRIRAAVDRYLKPVVAESTRIVMAENKNDAGMMGAFYHFMDMQRS